jgi:membrane-bound metal-dependent hydrolase YbcI (DUF457 family)
VSWAAHELESYFLQKHINVKVSYLAVLLGCLLPDLFTKLPVYGVRIAGHELFKASVPYKYHRGWPGVGFTHTLLFGLLFATVVLVATKNRAWFTGLVIGSFAHVLTDMFDSVGTMVLFPFTTQHYSVGMWAYASQQGRYGDAAAYYSSLGGVWDFLWLCLALSGFRVFSREYFFDRVVPADPVWGWMRRRFRMSDRAMLAVYRSYFVYGGCRIFAWFGWARWLNPRRGLQVLDWQWGGPEWAWPTIRGPISAGAPSWGDFILVSARAALLWAIAVAILWQLVIKRLYLRAA